MCIRDRFKEKYYSDDHSDWTYYNSDYYYQCNDTNAALRESAWKMTEKWEDVYKRQPKSRLLI